MQKQLVYAEASRRGDQLIVEAVNHDDDFKVVIVDGSMVGRDDAVWLFSKRGETFFTTPLPSEDSLIMTSGEAKKKTIKKIVNRATSKRMARFVEGPGIWCRNPQQTDILWVGGQPNCQDRLAVALALCGHRGLRVQKVRRISTVCDVVAPPEGRDQPLVGFWTDRNEGERSAIFKKGNRDPGLVRVAHVPWLVQYEYRSSGRLAFKIQVTDNAYRDAVADALVDGCGLFEIDLFCELLLGMGGEG